MDNMRQEMARQGQAMMMDQAKMASADAKFDPEKTPSPMSVGMLINDQVFTYNRGDLRKMAMAIKQKIPCAKEAFHFIYGKIRGFI
jgi:hypothetical protein